MTAPVDDEESADAEPVGLDVTPRIRPAQRPGAGRRRVLAIGGVVLLLGALGVVVFNGLNDAATFYYNVDEAVAQRDTLGDQRFRMQGNVVAGTIDQSDEGVTFTLAFGDAAVPVTHTGAPPELFDAAIPVIIEGRFDGDAFRSDEILIKHDASYEEENDARLRTAEADAEDRAGGAG